MTCSRFARSRAVVVAGLVALAHAPVRARAQEAPPQPPIRTLARVTATSSEPLQAVAGIRVLSNGWLLANDIGGRRLVLLDSQLRMVKTILGAGGGTGQAYGDDLPGLLAFRGDSSVFVDEAAQSLLVINPQGAVTRVTAIPPGVEASDLFGGPNGWASFDPQGRLVFRGTRRRDLRAYAPDDPNIPDAGDGMALGPILRVSLASHRTDTLAYLAVARPATTITVADDRSYTIRMVVNAMPTTDDWVLMPDGTVMIVRGRDFHLEHVRAPGRTDTLPKIPFQWQSISMEVRQALIDSARVQMTPRMQMLRLGTRRSAPTLEFVPPGRMSGYRPAFYPGMSRADPDGRVWIRTTDPSIIGPVYFVVDTTGKLVDRIRLPLDRVLLAVAPGGVLYMAMKDAGGVVHIERGLIQ